MNTAYGTISGQGNRGRVILHNSHLLFSRLPAFISKPLLTAVFVIIIAISVIIIVFGLIALPFNVLLKRSSRAGLQLGNVIDANEKIEDPIAYLKVHYAENGEAYQRFLSELSNYKVRGLERFAQRMNLKAAQKIDCGRCANCCKTMTPVFRKSDVLRITAAIGIKPREYYGKHLIREENGDYVHRALPCHFLGKDNKCMIYPIRPADCRGFPHLSNWFYSSRKMHMQNIDKCPITLNVVEKIHELIREKGKTNLSEAV